jgi:hypothetical protein
MVRVLHIRSTAATFIPAKSKGDIQIIIDDDGWLRATGDYWVGFWPKRVRRAG